jgi:predicted TIM-barrel fold metal-dependent hydrolase
MKIPIIALILFANAVYAQQEKPPIIDMHLHAHTLSMYGTSPPTVCTNDQEIIFPAWDPSKKLVFDNLRSCEKRLSAPENDEQLLRETIDILNRYNIRAVTTGPLEQVAKWQAAAPDRIIPATPFDDYEKRTPAAFRQLFDEKKFAIFAEISNQYNGISPDDQSLEPYFALAEQLDIPIGIHMGEGPPGAPFAFSPKYRAALTNPYLLEEVLIRHPRLRIYVMHAGSPMIDEMIAMLRTYPQLYVDIACNVWSFPRKDFYSLLGRLVDAGYEKRILFGSDQMIWPHTIEVAIDTIEKADFITAQQKRNIFYNNAARFLRLEK